MFWPLNAAVPSIVTLPFPWAKVSLGNMTQIYIQERVSAVTCPVKSVGTFRRRVLLMPDTSRWAAVRGVAQSQTRLSDWATAASTFRGLSGKETQPCSLGWEGPRSRKWQLAPAFWPQKLCGQRSLAGCSPWGRLSSTLWGVWLYITRTVAHRTILTKDEFVP